MKPLSILVVNDFAHVNGGASQVALASAAALAERGHAVHLLAAVGPIADEIKASGVQVTLTNQHEIARDPRRLRAMSQGVWNRKAARSMQALLAELDPGSTVVHFHVWVKALSSSVVRAVIEAGFPAVITLHDYFVSCPNGGLFNYQKNQICELLPMSAACLTTHCDKRNYSHKLWRSIRQIVQMHTGRVPSALKHFITISELSERLLQPYLPPEAVIHRVRNPIGIERLEAATPSHGRHAVFVGRLDPEKGALLLAEAANKAGTSVVFVGDGPIREQIRALLPEAELTGWIPPTEVGARLRAARALVLPSLWYETMGLTVLEAAAVGVPAIVPDRCAAAELVEHGVTGLIFRSGDRNDLADKLLQIEDDSLVESMGRAACERYWASPQTVASHAQRLEEVYRAVIGR